MNYYAARELQDKETGKGTGIWHFTCENGGQVWPVGYCHSKKCKHETAEEACECYRQYQLDNAQFLKVDKDTAKRLERCEMEGCNEFTASGATIGNHSHFLCEKHLNRESLDKLIGSYKGLEITSSY